MSGFFSLSPLKVVMALGGELGGFRPPFQAISGPQPIRPLLHVIHGGWFGHFKIDLSFLSSECCILDPPKIPCQCIDCSWLSVRLKSVPRVGMDARVPGRYRSVAVAARSRNQPHHSSHPPSPIPNAKNDLSQHSVNANSMPNPRRQISVQGMPRCPRRSARPLQSPAISPPRLSGRALR